MKQMFNNTAEHVFAVGAFLVFLATMVTCAFYPIAPRRGWDLTPPTAAVATSI